MDDILVRLQNQPKINGAHPKDIEDAIKEIIKLRDRICADSWIINPDRSGGAYTQDEIDNVYAWK